MVYEIRTYGDPVLKSQSLAIENIDDKLVRLTDAMFDIMYEAQGVGLAANQVALPYRLFIVNVTGQRGAGEELVFLNPALSRPRGTAVQEEGCLSLPGLRMDVRRPERVVVDAWSLDGQSLHLDLDGFLARVVQHEFDHLEGRLFTDRRPDAAALEARRVLASMQEVFIGRQARGECLPNDQLVARLDALEADRCVA